MKKILLLLSILIVLGSYGYSIGTCAPNVKDCLYFTEDSCNNNGCIWGSGLDFQCSNIPYCSQFTSNGPEVCNQQARCGVAIADAFFQHGCTNCTWDYYFNTCSSSIVASCYFNTFYSNANGPATCNEPITQDCRQNNEADCTAHGCRWIGEQCLSFMVSGSGSFACANITHKGEDYCNRASYCRSTSGWCYNCYWDTMHNRCASYLNNCTPSASGLTTIYCTDTDHDGYNQSNPNCGIADCNDNNNLVHPNSIELCNNLDDNCNGLTDENIIPIANDNQQGVCQGSIKSCSNGNYIINYSLINNYQAIETVCDSLDNDCDSSIDESCIINQSINITSNLTTNLTSLCGNYLCEYNESIDNCPFDCNISINPLVNQTSNESIVNGTIVITNITSICGNKVCESNESISCPSDCIPTEINPELNETEEGKEGGTGTGIQAGNKTISLEGEKSLVSKSITYLKVQINKIGIYRLMGYGIFFLIVIMWGATVLSKYTIPKYLLAVSTYISDQREKGYSDEEIRKDLSSVGWPKEKIEEGFRYRKK